MASSFVPSKLKNICINRVVQSIELHVKKISYLPVELKDRILYLMSKRGSLRDSNIAEFLHTEVSELDLSESEVTDVGLKKICNCGKLRKLDLNTCKGFRRLVTADGIKHIAKHCQQLEIVFLRRCTLIDDAAITLLTECCANLTQLNLENCSEVTDVSVGSIAENCSKLTSLSLSRTKVTNEGMKLLSQGRCAKQLMELYVSDCSGVTDIGVLAINDCCLGLKIFDIHGCQLTGEARARLQLRRMKQISWTIY